MDSIHANESTAEVVTVPTTPPVEPPGTGTPSLNPHDQELIAAIEKVISLSKGRCKKALISKTQFGLVFDLDEATVELLKPTVEALSKTGAPTGFGVFGTRPIRIMIVEDDDISRMWLKRILKQIPNCEIIEAMNGNQALNLLRTEPLPDLCLSDVNMPELDGIQLLQCIRDDQTLKSLDVILCTARNDRESVTKALSLSVTGYLIKPFAAAKVIEKVNESLKRSAAKLGLAAQAA